MLHIRLSSLLAYHISMIIITPTVSNFERVHINDYSCTRSTNLVIFTRGPQPNLGNGLPGVPLPLVCGFLAAYPDPSIRERVVRWHVKSHAARVNSVDKVVVIRLVSDDSKPGPYLFALYLGLVVSEATSAYFLYVSINCDIPEDPWHDLKYDALVRAYVNLLQKAINH